MSKLSNIKITLVTIIAIVIAGGCFAVGNYFSKISKDSNETTVDKNVEENIKDDGEEVSRLSESKGAVVTYFPGWAVYSNTGKKFEVKDIPWDKVTQVNHSFFEVTENGEIQTTDKWSDFENTALCPDGAADWTKYPQTGYPEGAVFGHFGAYKYYKEKYPDVKILIAIGGWTRSNNFHEVAKDSSKRENMAKSMIELMKQYPFIDGFDIDWEYPGESRESSDQWDRGAKGGPEDKENFTLLLKDIRESFNNNNMKDKMLTVAISASPNKMKNIEPDKFHKYVDLIGVMTYDFAGGWDKTTGHLASIYPTKDDPSEDRKGLSLEECLELLSDKYKVPNEKILGGSPFYSRGWGDVEAGPNGDGLYQAGNGGNYVGTIGPAGQFRFSDIKEFEKDSSWKKYVDKTTKTPYLYNKTKKTFLTYEDEESLKERISFINKNKFGGLILWDTSCDDSNGYPLHTLAFEGLGNKNKNSTSSNKEEDNEVDNKENVEKESEKESNDKKEEKKNESISNDTQESSGTWEDGKSYGTGDVVTYNGKSYKCIQGHTSQADWTPSSAPSLWKSSN